jgi:hypothetical protein
MAERRTARAKQDLTPDELAPAADERGEALTIVGVLGESSDADAVRLFLDAQFQTFDEIPREAILRRTRVPAERSPLGVDCSAVVVPNGTELTVHRVATRRVEDEFLSGEFTTPGTFTPRTHGVGTHEVPSHLCPPSQDICFTDPLVCLPTVPRCVTFEVGCQVTHDPACERTLASICCGTGAPACRTILNCPSFDFCGGSALICR